MNAIQRARKALTAHDAPLCGRYTSSRTIGARCDLPAYHDGPCREVEEPDAWELLREVLAEVGRRR